MSQAPHAVRGIRSGVRYGLDVKMEDTLAHALVDQYPKKTPMGVTAENLAAKYHITRADADAYAVSSQQRWAKAQADGRFGKEIVPIDVKVKKSIESFKVDEAPRPNTSLESLGKLSPVFIKDTGVVTAG